MRYLLLAAAACLLPAGTPGADPREIVRKSIELDHVNWVRMEDYTWTARETTRHLDSAGKTASVDTDEWETVILFGRPYRREIARDGKLLDAEHQRKEQEKIDRATARLERESPEERARHLADYEKEREKDREFLREIPDAFDFQLVGEEPIEGREAWVIHASPKPGYRAKHSDAKAFSKIEGRIWIDQVEYQWVRVAAKTLATISWGWFLARLNPGATVEFEQTRVNDQVWLPKRELLGGSGRLAALKRISEQQEILWTNYRKFQVDSKIISTQ
ncbi:MAG TPA: hypothetical protein VK419_13480 [Bryobacteraceae bacterium]|nr:hypothetical protein [Bryobacteraceae bacterium]